MTKVYNSELVQVWESPQADVVHYVPKESSKIIYTPKGRSDTITNSVWELSLKHHQGKLPELSGAIADLPGLLQADGFEALPISLAHGLRAGAYSQPHRDPFDRLLAAQAELDRLVLLSADPQLSTFPCQILW